MPLGRRHARAVGLELGDHEIVPSAGHFDGRHVHDPSGVDARGRRGRRARRARRGCGPHGATRGIGPQAPRRHRRADSGCEGHDLGIVVGQPRVRPRIDCGPLLGELGLSRHAGGQVAIGAGHDQHAGVGRVRGLRGRPRDAAAHRQAEQVASGRRTPQAARHLGGRHVRELIGEREPGGRGHGAVAVDAGVGEPSGECMLADDVVEGRFVGADDATRRIEVVPARPAVSADDEGAVPAGCGVAQHEALGYGHAGYGDRHRAFDLHDAAGGRHRRDHLGTLRLDRWRPAARLRECDEGYGQGRGEGTRRGGKHVQAHPIIK